eukprot:TRINITY_DN31354_c0_g1_i1.p2 TRINITY_DN31354_c0_g1~~TRINITY_DN31354_c0_g1_i1.p2  ORF type:complete len:102 (+),score=22.82 TRINITY_DN31354_c0_g1_i1:647-952(+)
MVSPQARKKKSKHQATPSEDTQQGSQPVLADPPPFGDLVLKFGQTIEPLFLVLVAGVASNCAHAMWDNSFVGAAAFLSVLGAGLKHKDEVKEFFSKLVHME